MEEKDLIAIFQQFDVKGDVSGVQLFGSGHINDTYLVTLSNWPDQFVLQRINHFIFKDIHGLMDNFFAITTHLAQKSAEYKAKGRPFFPATIKGINCHNGNSFYQDIQGNYWRLQTYIEESKTYDKVETYSQAFSAGVAFGLFQNMVQDLSPENIQEILPDFHHIGKRLDKLFNAVATNSHGRVELVDVELDAIHSRINRMHSILNKGVAGIIPLRILHNDTKLNNVLLDRDDRILCVIDLDTVMPGYLAYDFGDAIRTIINGATEDESVLDRIHLNIPFFKAYTEGYFSMVRDTINKEEIESLMEGVLLLPYMQAVRFLTDYLEGDHYYKTKHENHNLQRTRAQIRLLEELEKHEFQLAGIIKKSISH